MLFRTTTVSAVHEWEHSKENPLPDLDERRAYRSQMEALLSFMFAPAFIMSLMPDQPVLAQLPYFTLNVWHAVMLTVGALGGIAWKKPMLMTPVAKFANSTFEKVGGCMRKLKQLGRAKK